MSRSRNRAPFRWCDECGKLVQRSWREYILCIDCNNKRKAMREHYRKGGESFVKAFQSSEPDPRVQPWDADDIPF